MSAEKGFVINMFGEFSISYGEQGTRDAVNRSKKVWTILEYLISFRDREISQAELIELLWPDDELDNPANTLKTLLHRVRNVVADIGFPDPKNVIVYRRGTYGWNNNIPTQVDTETFENLLHQAEYCTDPAQRLSLLLQAVALYRGDFLPKNALDSWIVPINAYYNSQYIRAVVATVELLSADGRWEEIVDICQKAAVISPYEEQIHLSLIRSLVTLEQYQQALAHYDYVTNLFFTKFGINPSKELTALYREVIKQSKSTEMDLNIIKEDLSEQEARGAFFCEYEFFKNVYQLEARSAARSGHTVFLCLLSMADASGKALPLNILNRNMTKLKDCITHSLRRGDVFTRYSVSQYLIMLPTTSYENGNMVINRLSRAFHRKNPKAAVVLNYSLQPLSPVELAKIT